MTRFFAYPGIAVLFVSDTMRRVHGAAAGWCREFWKERARITIQRQYVVTLYRFNGKPITVGRHASWDGFCSMFSKWSIMHHVFFPTLDVLLAAVYGRVTFVSLLSYRAEISVVSLFKTLETITMLIKRMHGLNKKSFCYSHYTFIFFASQCSKHH